MENKDTKQKNIAPVQLQNLKQLSGISSTNSIASFFNELENAKKVLNDVCKELKEMESLVETKPAPVLSQTVVEQPKSDNNIIQKNFTPKPDRKNIQNDNYFNDNKQNNNVVENNNNENLKNESNNNIESVTRNTFVEQNTNNLQNTTTATNNSNKPYNSNNGVNQNSNQPRYNNGNNSNYNGNNPNYNGQPRYNNGTNPNYNGNNSNYNGQPRYNNGTNPNYNGNNPNYNGQPRYNNGTNPNYNGNNPNYNGQPRFNNGVSPNYNGNNPNYNGQPRYNNGVSPNYNGNNPNYNGQPRYNNGNNSNYNGNNPNYNGQPRYNNGVSPNYNGNNPNYNGQPRYNNGTNPNFNGQPRYNNGTNPNFNGQPRYNNGTNPNYNGQPRFNNGAPVRREGAKPFAEPLVLNVKPERTIGNKNKTKVIDSDKKELSKKAKLKMGYIVEEDNFFDEDRIGRVRSKNKKQKELIIPEKIKIDTAVITTDNLTVKILSEKIGKPAVDIIKKFMMLGLMLNINSIIDYATAELVASEFGIALSKNIDKNFEERLHDLAEIESNDMCKRPPIVTVMGHVDHGKTSLLDALKKTNVTASESGGITQHIGAYSISINNEKITFIDTPGHEAFTAMRMRGAMITDIAILVVAADDGIMPQSIEAIKDIKKAKVPLIVAINKIDKPEANIERIKQQLTEHEILPEEWGGDTICVPISAKTGLNLDKLLQSILLVAEMQDLKADYNSMSCAYVIESRIDKGRGIIANAIIKTGTLKIGDFIVCGICSGRVRAMVDYLGNNIEFATPSTAVSILGFTDVPEVGDMIYSIDERMAKNVIEERTRAIQIEKTKQISGVTLESFLQKTAGSELKEVNVIIKADVKGSAEAIKQTVEKIQNEEVKITVISTGVGNINESDVLLAQASNALVIAFNVKPDSVAREFAEKNKIIIEIYKIIYDIVDKLTLKINSLITPKYEEVVVGHAEVRQVFKISSKGTIAGSYMLDGVLTRNNKAKLLRDKAAIVETTIETLQQGKDDTKSIKAGYECGIKLKNFNDILVGDIIECIETKRIN